MRVVASPNFAAVEMGRREHHNTSKTSVSVYFLLRYFTLPTPITNPNPTAHVPSATSTTSLTTSASKASPPSTWNRSSTLVTCVASASAVFSSFSRLR